MPSTFTGIEIGKRGLDSHSRALTTVGHNIGNASTEGFSRQRVDLNAATAIFIPGLGREERAGQLGQGVEVAQVTRIRDQLLERRIVSETNVQGYWTSRDQQLLNLEQIYNEPTDVSVRSTLDRFWQSWQDLSLHPTELSSRQSVLSRADSLIESINGRFSRLTELRNIVDDDIRGQVELINDRTREIAALNGQILKVEAQGDSPNDLYDRRDLMVQQLAARIDIVTVGRDPNEFTIHSAGTHLVQGRVARQIETFADPENEGYVRLLWADTRQDAFFRGGELAALLEVRDSDLRGEIQKLDMLTINFIDLVNDVHRRGFTLGGQTNQDFFVELPTIGNISGNVDRDSDGTVDSSFIFRISGANTLGSTEQVGLGGTLTLPGPAGPIEIDYFPSDTVEMIIERVNLSGAEVVARLNHDGELTVKGTPAADRRNPDFVIRHLEDSGQFLVGYAGILLQSGEVGAFDSAGADAVLQLRGGNLRYAVAPLQHPAGWIGVDPSVANDPTRVAAAFSQQPRALSGDGSAALAISRLRTEPVMIGANATFDDFFASVVADMGLRGAQAREFRATEDAIMKQLTDMRESVSGVNLDEEFSEMIKFQQGFAAAARFIAQFDSMIDTIINRMGV
jgi:flagellar hook-associated protein 1 FlgK